MGARGYLIKDVASRLEAAIRAVAAGKTYFSPSVTQFLSEPPGRARHRNGSFERLTPRQLQVLRLIADGWSNKQIAAMLNLSIKTVDTHRTQLMQRLGIHDLASLVRYALRAGVATDER